MHHKCNHNGVSYTIYTITMELNSMVINTIYHIAQQLYNKDTLQPQNINSNMYKEDLSKHTFKYIYIGTICLCITNSFVALKVPFFSLARC